MHKHKFILGLLCWFSLSHAFAAESDSAPVHHELNYEREIFQENGIDIYVVNSRAPHLFMISRDLYGQETKWQQIANWNGLMAPYHLSQGQHLILRMPPTLSPEQGDQALIKAWESLHRSDVAQAIALNSKRSNSGPMPASVVEENASTVASPASSTLKVEMPHEHASRWNFSTSAAASLFRLDSNYSASNVHNVLYSETDYGVELEAGYHLSEETSLFLSAAVEKMDIRHSSSETEVEGESQLLWKFGAGVEYEMAPDLAAVGAVYFDQLPYAEPTMDGTKVTGIFIPEVSLGLRYNIYSRGNFKSTLVTDGLLLLPKKQDSYDLQSGKGFVVGANFANKLAHNTLNYGLTYRYLEQDTAESTNNLKVVLGNVGLSW